MARYKSGLKKSRLASQGKKTRWAPFWTIFKIFGKGKKIHPSRITTIKRSWRRTRLRLKPAKLKKSPLG